MAAVAPAQVIYQQWPHVDAGVRSAGAPGQFPETRFGENVSLPATTIGGVRWIGHAMDAGAIAGFLVEVRRNDDAGVVAGDAVYAGVIPYADTSPTALDANAEDGGTNVEHTVRFAPIAVDPGVHYVTIGAITEKPFLETWYWNRTATPFDFISCVETTIFTGFLCINPGDLALQVLGPGLADSCASAPPIFIGTTPFDTSSATTDGPAHAAGTCTPSGQIHEDVWYRYTASCNGLLGLKTCDAANFDTALAVYADGACPPAAASLIACNDDGPTCGGGSSSLAVPVSAGASYLVRVGGAASGQTGSGELQLTLLSAGGESGVLRLALPTAPTGFDPGRQITVRLEMTDLCAPAAGVRARLVFDPTALVFDGATYAAAPFGLQQPVTSRVTGLVELAAYAQLAMGQTGSSDDATLVELHFSTIRSFCVPPVAFDPAGEPSVLVDVGGNPIPGHTLEVDPPSTGNLADVNLDGLVNVDDLLEVILQWGACPFPGAECPADIDCSGGVNVDDLVAVIIGWTA